MFASIERPPEPTGSSRRRDNPHAGGIESVAPKAVYHWEHSMDQEVWTPLPETMLTRTEVSGLESAKTYSFRFRAFTRAGWQDYSQVVSLLVI